MKYRHLFLGIICCLASCIDGVSLFGQNTPDVLLYIQVKGLRSDLLEHYRSAMKSKSGFSRLFSTSFVSPNVQYSFLFTDPLAPLATLSTGATPQTHRITRREKFDPSVQKVVSVFQDSRYGGVSSSLTLSPHSLVAETLADVYKFEAGDQVSVISIATIAEEAIAMGGYHSDGVFWIDPNRTSWGTSSFYQTSLPKYLSALSAPQMALSSYAQKSWAPLQKMGALRLPYYSGKDGFSISFSSGVGWDEWRRSPLANEAVTGVALEALQMAHKSKKPLLLSLIWNAYPTLRSVSSVYAPEVFDTYMRMDQDLDRLIQLLTSLWGEGHFAVVLVGIPSEKSMAPERKSKRDTIFFREDRCIALINMYLGALYGRENWVKEIKNGSVFLNREAIKKQNIDLSKIQAETALFMTEIQGMDFAVPIQDRQESLWDDYQRKKMRSRRISGEEDVIFFLLPETDESPNERVPAQKSAYSLSQPTPLFIHAPGVVPQISFSKIEALDIVPTLSYILKIRPPNRVSSYPLFDIYREKK